MRRIASALCFWLLLMAATVVPWQRLFRHIGQANSTAATGNARAARQLAAEAYGRLPIRFEANQGQADAQVDFLSRGNGYNVFLTRTEAVMTLPARAGKDRPSRSANDIRLVALRMKLAGANPSSKATGETELPGGSNYLIGNDPNKWRLNVPGYGRVRYKAVYPGIDLVYYGNQRQLEFDFVVAAGADPNSIDLEIEGADRMTIEPQGDLLLRVADSQIVLPKPVIYQDVGSRRCTVPGHYVRKGSRGIVFRVEDYDRTRQLIIDPVLSYSTYLGGYSYDNANAIAVDVLGNAYLTGEAMSSSFPTTSGAFQPTCPPNTLPLPECDQAFVTKLNAAGTAIVYSTYLGGLALNYNQEVNYTQNHSWGNGIAVDSAGDAYITGVTAAPDFPTMNALQPSGGGGVLQTFIAELNPAGSALIFSTYWGGSGGEAIALDSSGNTYIAGLASVTGNLEVTPNNLSSSAIGCFVSKFSPSGSSRVYSVVYGDGATSAEAQVFCSGIAVDAAGDAYVTGTTTSKNLPVKNAFQPVSGGFSDAFVFKLNTMGSDLVYSTYLGGSGDEMNLDLNFWGGGIAVDASGNAYVVGSTDSPNFPVTTGAFQTQLGKTQPASVPPYKGFVTKFNPAGSALVYSTFIGTVNGAPDNTAVSGVAVDAAGNVYAAGITSASGFAIESPVVFTLADGRDAFVTKLNASGSALVYSTYLGGGGSQGGSGLTRIGPGIAIDGAGNAYVAGTTTSNAFSTIVSLPPNPCTTCSIQHAFALKLDNSPPSNPVPAIQSITPATVLVGGESLQLTVQGSKFISRAVVRVNGSDRPTAFNDSGNLVATLPASDRAAVGTAQIAVFNPSPSGGVSNVLPFAVEPNPLPNLTVLSPNAAVAGAPAFTLSIIGSGFVSSSVVQWNGVNRSTTTMDGRLNASIAASDIAAAGAAKVTVVNPSPGGGSSNPLVFTIIPQPTVTPGGVVGAANFTAPLVAGSIGSVFGTNLAVNGLALQGFPPPLILGTASVVLGGQYAPLFFTSPSQINFQVPWELVGNSTTSFEVIKNGAASNAVSVDLAGFNPGIFTLGPTGQGAVLIAGSSEVAGATGSIPGQALRPVNRGEYISIYCTGLGAVTNQPLTGAPGSATLLSVTTTAPSVTIGGQAAPATDGFFSGLAPGFVGLYQVNVQVPADAPTGNSVPLVISIGTITSNSVTIAVQ